LYLAADDKAAQHAVFALAETLRDELPSLRIRCHVAGLKNINNKARQSGAALIVLIKQTEQGSVASLWNEDALVQSDIALSALPEMINSAWQ